MGYFREYDYRRLQHDGGSNLRLNQHREHDGRAFYLHPLNPAYEDSPAEGVVVGYLVGIVRMAGSKKVTVYDATGIIP